MAHASGDCCASFIRRDVISTACSFSRAVGLLLDFLHWCLQSDGKNEQSSTANEISRVEDERKGGQWHSDARISVQANAQTALNNLIVQKWKQTWKCIRRRELNLNLREATSSPRWRTPERWLKRKAGTWRRTWYGIIFVQQSHEINYFYCCFQFFQGK